jgi:hypothetical protein
MSNNYHVENEKITIGDRIALGILAPPISVLLGYTILFLYKSNYTSILGIFLNWILIEFLFSFLIFTILLFIWAVAEPKFIARILSSARNKVIKWILVFYVVSGIAWLLVYTLTF